MIGFHIQYHFSLLNMKKMKYIVINFTRKKKKKDKNNNNNKISSSNIENDS
jgi:hypothetical protein